MPRYEACPYCLDHRNRNLWHMAKDCSRCEGKGYVRVRTNLCNKCAGPLILQQGEHPGPIYGGLVNASVHGSDWSNELSSDTSYMFSLCEKCLRDMFNSFAVGPAISFAVTGDGSYEAEREYYEFRKWRDAGGQKVKLLTGICNGTEHCQNPSEWRIFISGRMSVEAVCEAHKAQVLYGNCASVPAKQFLTIPVEEAFRSDAELVLIANAWLDTTCVEGVATWFKYVPPCIGALLPSSVDTDNTEIVWIPNGITCSHADNLPLISLFSGVVKYGPSTHFKMASRWEDVVPANPLPALHELESEETE